MDDELRAFSYMDAVSLGLEPRDYGWKDVPVGSWAARLDFKTWADTSGQGHLVCYFSVVDSGKKYRLSAFRNDDGSYTAGNRSFDFAVPGLDGLVFELMTERNSRGTLKWLSAAPQEN